MALTFTGFTQHDFETFAIEGLEPRMEAIRDRIQPKFRALGETLAAPLGALAGNEMFVHIARHARRKVNAPKDTWMAFCNNKRGYKQHPHFQIGVFDDHVFMWLAFIYELPNKVAIAEDFLKNARKVKREIPKDYLLSSDHMQKSAVVVGDLTEVQFKQALTDFRDVKSAELLIGRHILADDPLLQDGEAFIRLAEQTFETLMPLYRLSLKA